MARISKNLPYALAILKTGYCQAVFVAALAGSFFLIPSRVFYEGFGLLALLFMLSFSLMVTCVVRITRERIALAKNYSRSALGLLASGLGLAALQVCGVGMPMCGMSIGISLLSLIFPGIFFRTLTDYAPIILAVSIAAQVLSLYFMKCFKRMGV